MRHVNPQPRMNGEAPGSQQACTVLIVCQLWGSDNDRSEGVKESSEGSADQTRGWADVHLCHPFLSCLAEQKSQRG